MTKRTRKRKKKKSKIYDKGDFSSGDGMLTSVWGPSLWHYLHTMSFNYPVKPSKKDKKCYKQFIYNLKSVLPCNYCRLNLCKNLKALPLTEKDLENRVAFSKWVYNLHEHINNMLGKKSGLTYESIRERYEHFRARCTLDIDENTKLIKIEEIKLKDSGRIREKEKGCEEPLYGKKSKCIIKIVPKERNVPTFQMDKSCKKTRKKTR